MNQPDGNGQSAAISGNGNRTNGSNGNWPRGAIARTELRAEFRFPASTKVYLQGELYRTFACRQGRSP